jgi:pilus assembly protein CpaE
MFKICVVCPDQKISHQLESMLSRSGNVAVLSGPAGIPSPDDLDRYLRIHAPQAVLMWSSDGDDTMDLVLHVRRAYPNLQVAIVCAQRDITALLPFMRAGVREMIFMPLDQRELEETIERLRTHGAGKDAIPKTGEVLCFLPAKPGVGASTIAVNTASALAEKGLNVLLVDADLGSGMVRFMLQIKHPRSIRDAANRIADMDSNLWPQLATKVREGLDVLHSGGVSPSRTLDSQALLNLLSFWRRIYDVICVDFSGYLEPYSLDLMREANKIFLVTTGELAALHLLKEKAQVLKLRDVADRIYAIQNRKSFSDELSKEQIEEVIELPVYKVFRNSYAEVTLACKKGQVIRGDSALGLEFRSFAAQLRGDPPARKRSALRNMLTALTEKPSNLEPLLERSRG